EHCRPACDPDRVKCPNPGTSRVRLRRPEMPSPLEAPRSGAPQRGEAASAAQGGVLLPMLAVGLAAVRVERQGVFLEDEAAGLGDHLLALFNLGVVKLFHPTAVQADQVIMVLAFVELI